MADPIGQLRGQSGRHDEGIGLGVPHVLLTSSFDDDVVRNGTLRKGSQVSLLPKLDELGFIEQAVLVPCSRSVWGERCCFAQGPGQTEIDSGATGQGFFFFFNLLSYGVNPKMDITCKPETPMRLGPRSLGPCL